MAALLVSAICCPAAAQNLVRNGSFEDGAKEWTIADGLMAIDTGVAHDGKSSLRLSWKDAKQRRLALEPLPLKAGKRYLMRAWIRCENVTGAQKGATFGIEWGGAAGWIGGAYPMGIGYTNNWTPISFLSLPLPEQATSGHVFATIDFGGTGTAWIDDIDVREIDAPDAFRWHVEPETVVGTVETPAFTFSLDAIAPRLFGEEIEVFTSLCSPPWNAKITEQTTPPLKGATLNFATSQLFEGVYKVSAGIRSRTTGRNLVEPEFRTVCKRPPIECTLDPHHGVLAAGAPLPAVLVHAHRAGAVVCEALTAQGESLGMSPPRPLDAQGETRIVLSGSSVPAGRYVLRLRFTSPDNPEYVRDLPVDVLTAADSARATLIGPDNLLRDRGRTWFPMFVYAHTAWDVTANTETAKRDPKVTADLLDHLAGTPFGLLDYATPIGGLADTVALADACGKRNIRLALSVKDLYLRSAWVKGRLAGFPNQSPEQIVRALAKRMRNHPAMAVWYTNDELSTEFFGPLCSMRQWLHEEDPMHPTLHVHYDLECIRELSPSFDIFGPELYPFAENLTTMAEWSDKVTASLPPGAPFWCCLWAFREEAHAKEKQKALAYLAIAKGARGLLFYSYHDLRLLADFEARWKQLTELAREIEADLPVLLQPEATRPCTTSTPGIALRTVQGDKGTWLLAVNAGEQKRSAEIDVRGQIDAGKSPVTTLPITEGRITLPMEPYAVSLIRLK